MSRNNISASWIFGIALLIIGALLFVERSEIFFFRFHLPWWVFSWHTFMIIIGVIILATTSNKTAGFVLIAIGGLTMLPNWWPLLLILLGLYLLTRGKNSTFNIPGTPSAATPDDSERIEVVTVFGGCNKYLQSENFRGGTIFAAFGGSEINLYGCKLAEGTNFLDVTTIFGGSTITAPSDWNIQIDVTPIFGGVSDKRIKSPNIVYDNTRILVIKGATIFGGIDIKN